VKQLFLILAPLLTFCISSCDEPYEFIFDENTISDYYNHEYWTNEIILLRNSLNLTGGELLKTEINLSISSRTNGEIDIVISKGYYKSLMIF
jgi:hypothetical protein